jgi:hypothetical protein
MGKSKKNKIKVNIGRKIPLDEQIVAGKVSANRALPSVIFTRKIFFSLQAAL